MARLHSELRDMEIATRVREAKLKGYHHVAVEAARNYLSIPMPVVALISAYEKAFDLPMTNLADIGRRDEALRNAYQNTIHYLRFGVLPTRVEAKNYAVAEVSGSLQGGEDTTEAA